MISRRERDLMADSLRILDDLDAVLRAVAREKAIRETVRETGEPYEIVAETMDAMISMGDEAVLSLMDGEPTTLQAGLARWLEGLAERYPGGMHTDAVSGELGALLAYPWPGNVTPEG